MDTKKHAEFPVALPGADAETLMWARPSDVEPAALDQLRNISRLPWVHGVRVMPDVHLGKGATVGSVVAMKQAVSPSAVGVDIGCGMMAVKTNVTTSDLPDDLGPLRTAIEAAVPVGFNSNDGQAGVVTTDRSLSAAFDRLFGGFAGLRAGNIDGIRGRAVSQCGSLGGGNRRVTIVLSRIPRRSAARITRVRSRSSRALGSGRSGLARFNHFIEVTSDDDGIIWLMLHSGSRYIGKELAERHINEAKTLEHNLGLPDRDLAVFLADTSEMDAYLHDLYWAQDYAMLNRRIMMATIKGVFARFFPAVAYGQEVNAHHNYVSEETYGGEDLVVTRKGAISAKSDEWGLIPGSMGTGSYVVKGLGNETGYCSASHGAGRRMSRTKAKKTYTVDDLAEQTAGVECRKDAGVVDEIPAAYKDLSEVIAAQVDLVAVHTRLSTLLCVKG